LNGGVIMFMIVIIVAFILIIGLGFFVMDKIDKFRKERSRWKGLPMDEED